MSTTVRSIEDDPDFIIIVWAQGGRTDEVIANSNGVTVEHVTRVVGGEVEFRFDDRTIQVTAGQEIILPLRKGYDVVVTVTPAEVHCFYPRSAMTSEDLEHLRSLEPKSWDTYDIARPRQQIDASNVQITTIIRSR